MLTKDTRLAELLLLQPQAALGWQGVELTGRVPVWIGDPFVLFQANCAVDANMIKIIWQNGVHSIWMTFQPVRMSPGGKVKVRLPWAAWVR